MRSAMAVIRSRSRLGSQTLAGRSWKVRIWVQVELRPATDPTGANATPSSDSNAPGKDHSSSRFICGNAVLGPPVTGRITPVTNDALSDAK